MRNMLIQETPLVADALNSIETRLPNSWRLESIPQTDESNRTSGGVVSLVASSEERVDFLVEAKRSGTSSAPLLTYLREIRRESNLPLLFVSDYIGPRLRDQLSSEGVSFADSTGWVSISLDSPLVLLTGQGAERSPRVGGRASVVRLNGVAVNRAIRSLCTISTPIGVRELANLADVSPGSASKLLRTLVSDGIVDRDASGKVSVVRRRELIRRWVQDYSFTKTNDSVGFFIAPRGTERTISRLTGIPIPVTLTGSAAARRLLPDEVTPVVPLLLLAVYTHQASSLVEELRLIPADPSSANVTIAVPQDMSILAEPIAPEALVLADLLTLPGRGDAEAEQLMDALAQIDQAWEA